MFPVRETHITRNMCWPHRGTHITRDMCLPGRRTHVTRDTCSWVEEDILPGICVSQVGEHISLGYVFPR